MSAIKETELIINPDGSIFHLAIRPEQLAHHVLLVGDPGRVKQISRHFSHLETEVQNREFFTHTGTYNGKRVTALSTGIGTDNIDIVLNELDALVNIDFTSRTEKQGRTALNLVRLGTCGALQEEIPVDSFVVSSHGLGFDGLLHFYRSQEVRDLQMEEDFIQQCLWPSDCNRPYAVAADSALLNILGPLGTIGITATANGFYGPQGREIRLPLRLPQLNEKLTDFRGAGGLKICNFEMETSALFGLSALLEHKAATVCVVIGNRVRKEFSKNYKPVVDNLIEQVLHHLTT